MREYIRNLLYLGKIRMRIIGLSEGSWVVKPSNGLPGLIGLQNA